MTAASLEFVIAVGDLKPVIVEGRVVYRVKENHDLQHKVLSRRWLHS